jgi:hypothetical protein
MIELPEILSCLEQIFIQNIMSRSKEKNQAKLKQIYGVNFPGSLFWLHEFIVEQRDCEDPIDLEDIGMYPCGVL